MTTETITKELDPIAERIKATMARLGMNQSQMGAYLGVGQNTVNNWVTGARKPNAVVLRLLDVLGTIEALNPPLHASLLPGKGEK